MPPERRHDQPEALELLEVSGQRQRHTGAGLGHEHLQVLMPLLVMPLTVQQLATSAATRTQRHEQVAIADGDALDKGVAVSPNGDLFVSLRGVGLLRSADNGRTWTPSQEGITFTNTLSRLLRRPGGAT